MKKLVVVSTMFACLSAVAAFAHHGTGIAYDNTKPTVIAGLVKEFSWTNPHAHLILEVKDANGQVSEYAVEMNSPGVMQRQGWTRKQFNIGDQVTDRITLNGGLRWEPYFGQALENGRPSNFSRDRFRQGIKSQTWRYAPAGFLYPGDPGFPAGTSGHEKQWLNFSPRVGMAWDLTGDGRMAVRASYGIAYDFPNGEFQFASSRLSQSLTVSDPPGGFDAPFAHLSSVPYVGRVTPDTQLSRVS